ncbi:hypothetical protein BBJ28_00022341 [Nothophytophthora sp. Chile5]|nr:hypothetical protein BBJ28_00022341 [Nothophytophthora sp. Chile5]
MEETAALLGATGTPRTLPPIKQRLAGVTGLLEQLRKREAGQRSPEYLSTLIPHVLPCLRDHNSKIAQSALEILELLVAQVPEATVRSYFKLLWISLVERLGDSKKAAEVVVEISVALDVSTVLEKLKACTRHKNWRTREQVRGVLNDCISRNSTFLLLSLVDSAANSWLHSCCCVALRGALDAACDLALSRAPCVI